MPFVLGNEVCDKLAGIGLYFSMILYLTENYHMQQVTAANVLSISNGTSSITPLIGGYLADAYLGRFWTLVTSSCISQVAMLFFVLSAAISSLRPAPCAAMAAQQSASQCPRASPTQLLFLFSAFALLSIAAGGIRPCAYPFGADQFNQSTFEGRKSFQSYSNWYFFGIYLSVLLSGTVVVYVQQSVSWAMGFGIPTIAMAIAIIVYVLGSPLYKFETPAGSPLKELAKVCTAAFYKRKLTLPNDFISLLDPPHAGDGFKLLPTDQFLSLDKAAIITEGDIALDGKVLKPWRICTVHQVEQLKLILRTAPIMISTMMHSIAVSQQTSFSVLQANIMNRHMFGSFHIPAASIGVFAMLTIMICLPLYDKVVLPIARKVRRNERGITFLQRIGIGFSLGVVAMTLSGIVEGKRRSVAIQEGLIDNSRGVVAMSVFWLVPQQSLMGLGEAFYGVGMAEFFYDQVPEGMRSTAGSLNSCVSGLGVYISAIVLTAVHQMTASGGRVSWLDDNLNRGRLDDYYYLVAGMIVANLVYFVVVAHWYTYKNILIGGGGGDGDHDHNNDHIAAFTHTTGEEESAGAPLQLCSVLEGGHDDDDDVALASKVDNNHNHDHTRAPRCTSSMHEDQELQVQIHCALDGGHTREVEAPALIPTTKEAIAISPTMG